MIVVQVCGYSGSGKTTVCRALAEALRAEGHRVAYVKHHHGQLERLGSDTAALSQAPLRLLAGSDGLLRLGEPPSLRDLLAAAAAAGMTVSLVEGFKNEPGGKIWLRRHDGDDPPVGVADVQIDLLGARAAALEPEALWRIAPQREYQG